MIKIRQLILRPEQNINLVLSTVREAKKKEKVTAELQLHSGNALAENFFSILKTECIYRTKLRTYKEARLLIDECIHFCNYQRIQLKTKLTPLELRNQFTA